MTIPVPAARACAAPYIVRLVVFVTIDTTLGDTFSITFETDASLAVAVVLPSRVGVNVVLR